MNESFKHIPFNKTTLAPNTESYALKCLQSKKIAGNGHYTNSCHNFLEQRYDFRKCLLTSSCTAALEMAAILCNLKAGDEVIVPSYTFPSTANAFLLRGAKVLFADSAKDNPNIDLEHVVKLITQRTKVLVVVHYAGIACDMDRVMAMAKRYNISVIEDAAQAIDAYYKGQPLGGIGHFGTFSFHETKNITCGEGGMLVINDQSFVERAEVIWQNGTDRSKFQRGEVDHYEWRDVGSSFFPSEVNAAILLAQFETLEDTQKKRLSVYKLLMEQLKPVEEQGHFQLPIIPNFSTDNAHIFYILLKSKSTKEALQAYLSKCAIRSAGHYYPLHISEKIGSTIALRNCERYANCLLRLPIYPEMDNEEVQKIAWSVNSYFECL